MSIVVKPVPRSVRALDEKGQPIIIGKTANGANKFKREKQPYPSLIKGDKALPLDTAIRRLLMVADDANGIDGYLTDDTVLDLASRAETLNKVLEDQKIEKVELKATKKVDFDKFDTIAELAAAKAS